MAHIAQPKDISVVYIRSFLGLNENPDGDTTLKAGEFSTMRNFRITRDGHLQKRPGFRRLYALPGSFDDGVHLYGAWRGVADGGEPVTLVNWNGGLYSLALEKPAGHTAGYAYQGALAKAPTHFFGFGGAVYILDGQGYYRWTDSDGLERVEGYVPVTQTATTPQGSGTALEPLNRLTGKREVEFSPDGVADTFHLPEREIDEVLTVRLNGMVQSGTSSDLSAGTVKLAAVPPEGTNTLSIVYRKGDGTRREVAGMGFSELFNGATDARVFLYGDGTNRAIYSGVCYKTGQPSAEYFPATAEVAVGEANTPITALVRHYSRMMAFKPGSAYSISASELTTQLGRVLPAFCVAPVNRQLGNVAPGQVMLVENDPVSVDQGGIYLWSNTNGYVGNNDNSAKRISDRVQRTLRDFCPEEIRTYNFRTEHEFWLLENRRALIYNYANDTWYFYDHIPFAAMFEADNEVYAVTYYGEVVHVSRAYHYDLEGTDPGGGRAIDCYAETGAMDFGRDWQLKYSPMLFVAIRPEPHARIYVTVESNRRSGYPEKLVSANLSTFDHADFAHFSFITNRKPQVRRVRLKVKKAAFYRLIYKSRDSSATATVIETDVRLRYAGNVR